MTIYVKPGKIITDSYDLNTSQFSLSGTTISVIVPFVDVRAYDSINAAVTAIGATQAILEVPTAQTLTANLTIPNNLTLKITQGGSIVKASTYTLTINGSLEAGPYTIFSGFSNGEVLINAARNKEVDVRWFGALGNNTANDTTAINLAISSMVNTYWNGTLIFSPGQYKITPGAMLPITCSVYGPNATFQAINDTDSWLFKLDYKLNTTKDRSKFVVNQISNLSGNKKGYGIYAIGAEFSDISIELVMGFNVGIYLDAATNGHMGECIYNINMFYRNATNILMVSGIGGPYRVECNIFNIMYIAECDLAVDLQGDVTDPTSNTTHNVFLINVMELSTNLSGFKLTGAGTVGNVFKVSTNLISASGTGKTVNCSAEVPENFFEFPFFNTTPCEFGAGQIVKGGFKDTGAFSVLEYKSRSEISGTAAPTVGYWRQGDECANIAAAAGGIPGWKCITSGTPGTWEAMPNLSVWTAWTSTLVWATATPTLGTVISRYSSNGKICHFSIYIPITDGKNSTGLTSATLPVVPADNNNYIACSVVYLVDTTYSVGGAVIDTLTPVGILGRVAPTLTNAKAGNVVISGSYEIA